MCDSKVVFMFVHSSCTLQFQSVSVFTQHNMYPITLQLD